ncbi:MAG: hypothetical protein ACKVPX_05120 [Myxococcaceae bacterium]
MNNVSTAFALLVVFGTTQALAQESEFKGKLKEDLDGYQAQIESSCGIKPKLEWTGGKLGHNPREYEKPEWNAISTLCTSGLSAVADACNNAAVKEKMAAVKSIQCAKGKGALSYKLKGDTLTLTIDQSFVKNNAAGQTSDLTAKLKSELDQ